MNTESYREKQHGKREVWQRLEVLLDKAAKGRYDKLTDKELAEVARLYRAATTHLAQMRTFGASAGALKRVNSLVLRGHDLIYGRPPRDSFRRVLAGALLTFPEVVRRTAIYHLLALMLVLTGAFYGYFGVGADPEWALTIMSGDERTPYADRAELRQSLRAGRDGDKVTAGQQAGFATFLWSHNTRVALLCFFAGFLAGIPTVFLLLLNGLLLGVYTATFHMHGLAYEWWAWILPHGVTEIGAMILLGGGGLYIGRQLAAPPGRMSRADALRSVRGDALHLLLFCFPMLLIAALLESFLRQSPLPDSGRYIVAAGTLVFWTLYLGLTRVPRRLRAQTERDRSETERWLRMPIEDELFAGLAPRRGRW